MLRRISAALGSGLFLLLAPGTVAGWLPHYFRGRYPLDLPAIDVWPVHVMAGMLIVGGLVILLDSFTRFALQGLGTPAPVYPTEHLVVTGLYRHVRNPMYVAVVSLVIGQGLLWASPPVLAYGGVLWLLFHIFVLAYEEPTLWGRYGEEYERFKNEVPRWIPRLTPSNLLQQ